MAASDGARTWQGVRSDRALGSQCRRTSGLVGAGHRARARRCACEYAPEVVQFALLAIRHSAFLKGFWIGDCQAVRP